MKKLSLFRFIVVFLLIFNVSTLYADEMDDGFGDESTSESDDFGEDAFGDEESSDTTSSSSEDSSSSTDEGFEDDSGSSDDDGFEDDSSSSGDDAFSDEGGSDVFDEDSSSSDEASEGDSEEEEEESWLKDFSGKITQQMALSYSNTKAQDIYSSLRSTLFINYAHKFENGYAVKLTGRAFYDGKYDSLNGTYTKDQIDNLRTETEIFEAYVEGSIIDGLDFKIGRQIEVWGRSDTIRVNDILNPVDNRRPGLLDVEDLRLPRTMAKFDYFIGDWRISPIWIIEDRFTKIPPYFSTYSPFDYLGGPLPKNKTYDNFGYALSIGLEGSGWDLGLYAAHIRDDFPYVSFITNTEKLQSIKNPLSLGGIEHNQMDMVGAAFNIVFGSWLFKTEMAYFNTGVLSTEFSRFDLLGGLEFTGFSDIVISYDVSGRNFFGFDSFVEPFVKLIEIDKIGVEHAFRISKDWVTATVHTSLLMFLYGTGFDEGGFRRVAVKYDLADGISANLSLIDYIKGSVVFDQVQDEYIIASDISYTF